MQQDMSCLALVFRNRLHLAKAPDTITVFIPMIAKFPLQWKAEWMQTSNIKTFYNIIRWTFLEIR